MEPMAGSTDSERRALGDAQPESTLLPAAGPMRCAADPSIETYLRCGRCEKSICPRCLIQTPVGARCRDCAQLRKLPMFDVRPLDYLRAVGGGLAAGIGGGFALILLRELIPGSGMFFRGIFYVAILAAFGYGVGTAVAWSTRRKQGTWLGIVAAFAVPIGIGVGHAIFYIVNGANPTIAIVAGFIPLIGSAWSLLGLLVAMAIAFSRAR
jgi:hypothetical protein